MFGLPNSPLKLTVTTPSRCALRRVRSLTPAFGGGPTDPQQRGHQNKDRPA